MPSRKFLPASLLAISAAAACLIARACLPPKVRIGVSLPLSGPHQSDGEPILNALTLAVEERNALRGRLGRRLELAVMDDANDPEKARRNAEAFASDRRIAAVVGPLSSLPGLAAAQVLDKAGIPVISPSITDPAFTASSPWAFSANDSDARQAELISAYLHEVLRLRSAAVFHGEAGYGKHLGECFVAKAREAGLALSVFTFNEDAPIPEGFAGRCRKSFPPGAGAVLIFSQSSKAARIVADLRREGDRLPVFGTERSAAGILPLLPRGGHDFHAFLPFMFDFASLKTVEFLRRYKDRFYGTSPSIYAAFAYDEIGMIDEALRSGGRPREAVRNHLARGLTERRPYEGVSGKLFFGPDRAADRDSILGDARDGAFSPAFVQLRLAQGPIDLALLKEKTASGEMLSFGGKNFHKVQVVFTGLDTYRVNRISPEDYQIEFFLWFKWLGNLDVENLVVLNADPSGQSRRKVLHRNYAPGAKEPPSKVRWISYSVLAGFPEKYDLRRFPFDSQRLPIEVAHLDKAADRLQLAVDRAPQSRSATLQEMPHEWTFLRREDYAGTYRYGSSFGNPDSEKGAAEAEYSVFHADLIVRRVLFPYLIRLFLPMAILIGVGLCILNISVHEFEARCETLMAAMLGVLVEHMTQIHHLPQVGYLMRSDLFYIATYFLMFVLVFENAWINRMVLRGQDGPAEDFERRFSWAFLLACAVVYGAVAASAVIGA
jgi:branched-chain amino acid transport system substrate-binding protein